MSPRLWLVRHATPLVAPGVCYGRLDVPAEAQATQDAAERLAQALPPGAVLWHSPLQRCVQLTRALCDVRDDLRPQPDDRLQEMHFGQWEGQAWDAITRADLDAWADDLWRYAPGGGECLTDMAGRVHSAWWAALAQARQQACDVVWISHAGVARCVQWLLQRPGAVPSAQDWAQLPAPLPGQWACHLLEPQGAGAA